MRKWIKRLSIIPLSLLMLLSGCINTGASGGGFDIVKFLQNKYVMMIGVLAIFLWMWSKRK
jgi:hypothetical protein